MRDFELHTDLAWIRRYYFKNEMLITNWSLNKYLVGSQRISDLNPTSITYDANFLI